MTAQEIEYRVDELPAEDIAGYIRKKVVTFEQLQVTGRFYLDHQEAVTGILEGYREEDAAFDAAKGSDTAEAFEAFKRSYPGSEHTGAADRRIAEIRKAGEDAAFEAAKRSDTAEAFEAFKRNYPASVHIGDVDKRVAEIWERDRERIEAQRREETRRVELEALDEASEIRELGASMRALDDFKRRYPGSELIGEADSRISVKMAEWDALLDQIANNINAFTPDGVERRYGADFLHALCTKKKYDYDRVRGWQVPALSLNDIVPQYPADIPAGFTEVFFWGIPSSGKTCALAAIINTIQRHYTMAIPADVPTIFGARYLNSLASLFDGDKCCYLPPPTMLDRTQYMPFLLKGAKEADAKYYRKVSFFELSGEVFKHFEEIVYGKIPDDLSHVDVEMTEEQQLAFQKEHLKTFAFKTLNLLLGSPNRKIHFFFIDYNQATEQRQQQNLYLQAAENYFFRFNNIFQQKTDAVYVVVTKADEIEAQNDEERLRLAERFLDNNSFGSFVRALETSCRKHRVFYKTMIFSIGDVYFSRLCDINRDYSKNIINELLDKIPSAGGRVKGPWDWLNG